MVRNLKALMYSGSINGVNFMGFWGEMCEICVICWKFAKNKTLKMKILPIINFARNFKDGKANVYG